MSRIRMVAASLGLVGSVPAIAGAMDQGAVLTQTDPVTQGPSDAKGPSDTALQPPAAEGDAAAIESLKGAIRDQIATLGANPLANDVEAAVMFAFSQSSQPEGALLTALDQLEAEGYLSNADAFKTAVGRVKLASAQGRLKRGSAALADLNSPQQLLTGPSTQSDGGGVANYTS